MDQNGESRSTKQPRFSLSQETIAIVTVGVALAGLILMNHGQIRAEREAMRAEARADRAEVRADRAEARAEREAMRAEARADRQAFAERIVRLVEQQGTLDGLVEGLQHAIPPRAHPAETSER